MDFSTEYKDISHPIVERCKKGEKKAFEELYNLYAKGMYNVTLRIVNKKDEAEEILQDAFLKAFENIDRFNKKYSFGIWLKRIVINQSLDVLKKRKPCLIPLSEENYSESDVTIEEDVVIYDVAFIKKCIQELPDGYRTILSLFLFEDYSHREIADLLGISEGTSKSQYSRAKKKLIQSIKNHSNGK